jgi:hypothetical protein
MLLCFCFRKELITVLLILLYFPGPAPDNITTEIFNITVHQDSYNIVPDLECDIDTLGVYSYTVSKNRIFSHT